jgi:Zn-dependent M28 family amino/carboxypeptidase
MNDIVVNINVDMVGRESIDTIYSVGSEKLSDELKEIVEETNEETVDFTFNYQFDEPNDPQRIYYRSDHYNYAKKGIPIVFFYDYMLEDYHKPTDDSDRINYKKIEKISTLITEIAVRVANLDHRLRVDIEDTEKESK